MIIYRIIKYYYVTYSAQLLMLCRSVM